MDGVVLASPLEENHPFVVRPKSAPVASSSRFYKAQATDSRQQSRTHSTTTVIFHVPDRCEKLALHISLISQIKLYMEYLRGGTQRHAQLGVYGLQYMCRPQWQKTHVSEQRYHFAEILSPFQDEIFLICRVTYILDLVISSSGVLFKSPTTTTG